MLLYAYLWYKKTESASWKYQRNIVPLLLPPSFASSHSYMGLIYSPVLSDIFYDRMPFLTPSVSIYPLPCTKKNPRVPSSALIERSGRNSKTVTNSSHPPFASAGPPVHRAVPILPARRTGQDQLRGRRGGAPGVLEAAQPSDRLHVGCDREGEAQGKVLGWFRGVWVWVCVCIAWGKSVEVWVSRDVWM